MGCLMLGVAALLALAVPASIARSSLVGAYIVIALLAALAVGTALRIKRRRGAVALEPPPRLRTALTTITVLTVLYAATVTIIALTG